jgi:hypothetical protein
LVIASTTDAPQPQYRTLSDFARARSRAVPDHSAIERHDHEAVSSAGVKRS